MSNLWEKRKDLVGGEGLEPEDFEELDDLLNKKRGPPPPQNTEEKKNWSTRVKNLLLAIADLL